MLTSKNKFLLIGIILILGIAVTGCFSSGNNDKDEKVVLSNLTALTTEKLEAKFSDGTIKEIINFTPKPLEPEKEIEVSFEYNNTVYSGVVKYQPNYNVNLPKAPQSLTSGHTTTANMLSVNAQSLSSVQNSTTKDYSSFITNGSYLGKVYNKIVDYFEPKINKVIQLQEDTNNYELNNINYNIKYTTNVNDSVYDVKYELFKDGVLNGIIYKNYENTKINFTKLVFSSEQGNESGEDVIRQIVYDKTSNEKQTFFANYSAALNPEYKANNFLFNIIETDNKQKMKVILYDAKNDHNALFNIAMVENKSTNNSVAAVYRENSDSTSDNYTNITKQEIIDLITNKPYVGPDNLGAFNDQEIINNVPKDQYENIDNYPTKSEVIDYYNSSISAKMAYKMEVDIGDYSSNLVKLLRNQDVIK